MPNRSRHQRRTLAEAFNPKRNSLNAIRLTLAVMVLVAHSWPLGGFGLAPMVGTEDLGSLAVACFFVISGYLISGSRLKASSVVYARHRLARIFPGYWVALLVTALLIAPIAAWAQRDIYQPMEALRYVLLNVTTKQGQTGIAGTLTTVPEVGAWNGSVWTLPYELLCYAGVGVLLSVPVARQRPSIVTAVFAVATAAAVAVAIIPTAGPVRFTIQLATAFLAGAVLRAWAHRVPLTDYYAAGAVAVMVATLTVGQFRALAPLPLAYVMFWLAVRLPFAGFVRTNDYSYGVYIYAFPVQQMLSSFELNRFGVLPFMLVSLAFVFPFACASWFLVESPSLRWARPRPPRTARSLPHPQVVPH